MRALGVAGDVEVDVAPVEIQPGDTFLLCSDGLYGMLPDEDLRGLTLSAMDCDTAVAWLVDAANQKGGTDNITAMVVRVFASARTASANADSEPDTTQSSSEADRAGSLPKNMPSR
jgi:protein phosphatase